MRVLAIEDHDVDFYLIERALGDKFEVLRSSTLAEGLAMLASQHFDLVVVDLTLADSSGFATFEKVKVAVPRTPVLVLSGLDDDELALRAVSSGAQDYIRKSTLLHCPLDRVARYAIERRRADDAARATELRYRTLLDSLPTAAYTCDPQGLLTYYNQKAVELWGRQPKLNDAEERFTGSYRLFSQDGAPIPKDQSLMGRALREKRAFNGGEYVIGLPTGERKVVLAHARPFLDQAGEVSGGINVLVDITQIRKIEQELRESERFARSTVNSLSAHVAILDENGSILAANTAWRRFAKENSISPSSADCVGMNYLRVCDAAGCGEGDFGPKAADGIRAVLRGERSDFQLEYPCHSPTQERWFVMRVTPFDGEGQVRVVVSHEDITSRKTAERLAQEQYGLREAVAGMEQVLGVVGHELRTPLAALRAISEYLLTDGARNTAEADHFLKGISEEVDRMSDTVNNLLEAARINSGRARWNWSEVDLIEIIEDSVATIEPLVDSAQVRIITRADSSAKSMMGDADAIRRLLVNLLSNARKYTTQGHIEVSNRQFSDANGSWIELVVSDTGNGIPPELTARLGEAFALNAGVVGRNHVSGTGLGLAICNGIVTAHGGKLLIESTQGRGTTVTARLRLDLKAAANGDTVYLASYAEAAA